MPDLRAKHKKKESRRDISLRLFLESNQPSFETGQWFY
jgi:hypothetical protein